MRRTIPVLGGLLATAAAISCGGSTQPNLPPTVTIAAPAPGATFFAGDPVTFTGSADDPETGPLAGSRLSWSSSLDGPLGTGVSLQTSALSAGSHQVTLTATDAGGAAGTAQVSIQVVTNQPPAVTIAAPSDGAEFVEGTPVSLSGSATDPESGPVPGSRLAWSSSRDGTLGAGAQLSTPALSVGAHVITLAATDDRGLEGSATIGLTILANQAPTASISEPADGAEFLQGVEVTFTGAGTDPEEGALAGPSLAWSSSRDGALGTGGSVATSALSVGDHVVTLTATDAQGRAGTATVSVRITTLTGLPPSADFTVDCSGLACEFSDASTDPDGTVTGWAWDFGDGGTSSDPDPQHVYATGGPYTITLVVTDDIGNVSDPALRSVSLSTPARAGFQIEVRVSPGAVLSESQRMAVENAVARWEEIITGDVPQTSLVRGAGSCAGAATPALNELIDDLVIYLEFELIDGPGGVLGSAGPCIVRGTGPPVLGGMRFDTADLASLETANLLEDVLLHEMGHVLGFGTLWDLSFGTTVVFDYLQDPTSVEPAPINDTHFNGPLAIAAFDEVSDPDYTAGEKVPVENDNTEFGAGSLNGHWREGIFTNELMTPRINFGSNPISLVTVESLRDLSYQVNAAAADPYSLSFALLAETSTPALELDDDIWRGPIEVVDPSGRVVGIAEPGP
ncbi:MAG: PKD domain-containing protein [Gemmatimonadota bacterium]